MNIEILYEDADICVVTKPSGVTVHKDGFREEETLADWFAMAYPASAGVGEPLTLSNGTIVDRPGIVHRLDKETSGVIVLAKHQEAFLYLKDQFQNRIPKKEYRAFVWGKFKDEKGSITLPIGRSRGDFRKRSAEFGAKPPLRDAHTDYSVLKNGKEYAYLALTPKTGRMHQLRVHLKAQSHPIICDRLYAPKKECVLGFERLALHAHRLSLTLPSGKEQTFEAPLPETFVSAETLL